MNDRNTLPHSPDLMSVEDTALLVLDAQEKLVPLLTDPPRVVWNIRRLLIGASVLGVRATASEQYPKGLGHTIEQLSAPLEQAGVTSVPEKVTFSCGG